MADMFAPPPTPPSALGRYRLLSPHAAIKVSPLCLGAMNHGDAWKSVMGSLPKDESFALLDEFVAQGGNFIDTANCYQDEQSEQWLGEWMESRDIRDRMVIATKFTTHYRAHANGLDASINQTGNGKKSLHLSLRDSLKKLRTEYIDILYLHWWDWTTSIPELMDSLDAIVKSGKVLYLGVSDTPAWIVSAANEYARAHGKTPFVVYQGRWNCMVRDFERDILPMARTYGMALCPWEAIGGGRLQSKAQIDEKKANGETLRTMMGGPEQTKEEEKYSLALDAIAKEIGLSGPTAVALAYLLQKAPYVFPIVGGRKKSHLLDNISALEVTLSEEHIKRIEALASFDPGFPHTFTGDDPRAHGGKPGGIMLSTIGNLDWVVGSAPIASQQTVKS